LNKIINQSKGAIPRLYLNSRSRTDLGQFLLVLAHFVPGITDDDGHGLLWWSLQHVFDEVVYRLIAQNVDCNQKDRFGRTPLELAIQKEREDLAKLLVPKGKPSSERKHVASPNQSISHEEQRAEEGHISSSDVTTGKKPLPNKLKKHSRGGGGGFRKFFGKKKVGDMSSSN
jgi:ankyrin repeat protein